MTSIMLPLPVAEDAIKRPCDQIKHTWLTFTDPAAVVPVFMRYCYYNAISRPVSRHQYGNIAKIRLRGIEPRRNQCGTAAKEARK